MDNKPLEDVVITTDTEQIDTNRFQGVVTIIGKPDGIPCTAVYACNQVRFEYEDAAADAESQAEMFYEVYKREHFSSAMTSQSGR